MIFTGATYQGDSPYFEDKLNKARTKLKEFPTILSIVNNFNLANRENHTENLFINLLSASVSDAFLEGKPNEGYNNILKSFEEVLRKLLPKLSRDKKNNLVARLKSFGDKHRETINEIEFLVELKQNSNISDIEYENESLGSHDFNIKIDSEEFNIEQTSLGESKIQQIVEEAFSLASKEIIERIPKKILLKIDVDTNKILKERDNSVEEVKTVVMEDYEKLLNEAYDKVKQVDTLNERFEIPKIEGHFEGKKTILTNFFQIASHIRRTPEHFQKFLLKELATSGHFEGERLVLNNKIPSGKINEKVEQYVKEFVLCKECGKPDTELKKEDRLNFVHCLACGAKHSVRSKI